MLPLQYIVNTNIYPDSEKVIGYLASDVIVASSKPCDDPSLRTKIFLFLLSICTEELLSTQKIITFFSLLPSAHENCERESNSMPQPLYLYLSGSAFLVSFTAPNNYHSVIT